MVYCFNFLDYLHNRKQPVVNVIDGSLSGLLPVASGEPQGYILGPLIFIFFNDDIWEGISEGSEITLYTGTAMVYWLPQNRYLKLHIIYIKA